MNKSKVSVVTNQIWQKIETILGWALAAFGIVALIMLFTSPKDESYDSVLTMSIIFLALGGLLIIKGKNRKKLIKDFKAYVQILAGDPYNSLDTIAERTNTPVTIVKKNLQQMIKKNYFANAVIDEGSNSLILNGRPDTQQILSTKTMESLSKVPSVQYQAPGQSQPQVEMLTIKCNGCGAVNVVPRGSVVECEYCGNMLKGE